MTLDAVSPSVSKEIRGLSKDYRDMDNREKKRWMVLRLVEAQIAGCVDLSPEEMVDAAFIMVDKINEKLYEKKGY